MADCLPKPPEFLSLTFQLVPQTKNVQSQSGNPYFSLQLEEFLPETCELLSLKSHEIVPKTPDNFSCTRDDRKERIVAAGNSVRQALQELLSEYIDNQGKKRSEHLGKNFKFLLKRKILNSIFS